MLQNGRDWIFIFRTNVGINHRWNCVKTPPTFSDNPKGVSEANCETVARYLLYLIYVGDSIVDYMTSAEGTLLKAVSLMNVDEKDDSDENKSDDAGGDTSSRDDTRRDGKTDRRTRSMVGKAQSGGGAGRGKGSSKITKRDVFRGGYDVIDRKFGKYLFETHTKECVTNTTCTLNETGCWKLRCSHLTTADERCLLLKNAIGQLL